MSTTRSIQHRCPRMSEHLRSPGGCACHPHLPIPCDECYSFEVISTRLPSYQPDERWHPVSAPSAQPQESAVFEPTDRPDWDDWFIEIARAVSLRADCTRRKVGAVIVKDHRIASTGYNGGPPKGPSCLKGQCPRGTKTREEVPGYADANPTSYDIGEGACIALHAEQNAIMYASREQRVGATIYVTCQPCPGCLREISGSGIIEAVWPEDGALARLLLVGGEWIQR